MRIWRHGRERGVVAVLVAVVLGCGVALGMGALVVDVGQLAWERTQLQNGADAAAEAVADDCLASGCAGSTAVTAERTRAGFYADHNAADGRADLLALCGSWGSLPSCTGSSSCLGAPSAGQQYVEVRLGTELPDGSTVLPPTFAGALAGGGQAGRTVVTCARVSHTTTTTTSTSGLPAAIWGTTTAMGTNPASVWLASAQLSITGLVHSNADIYVGGTLVTISPRVEYVTAQTVNATSSSVPSPVRVTAGPPPMSRDATAYRPGGSAALAAGSGYYAVPGSACSGGTWTYADGSVPATATVVYAPCAVSITGDVAGLLVAEGTITESAGSITIGPSGNPGAGGLVSNSTANPAISLAGSSITVYGNVQALSGGVDIPGSLLNLRCGVTGSTVTVRGSDVTVTADSGCAATTTTSTGSTRLTG